jgi:hypothetical protein
MALFTEPKTIVLFTEPSIENVWQQLSCNWEQRVERLTPTIKMCCWRRPHGADFGPMPYAWVRVYYEHGDGYPYLEEIMLNRDNGPLEVECVAHEMRVKYLTR